jgi:GTPase Era involved in 16S rRNA processing
MVPRKKADLQKVILVGKKGKTFLKIQRALRHTLRPIH